MVFHMLSRDQITTKFTSSAPGQNSLHEFPGLGGGGGVTPQASGVLLTIMGFQGERALLACACLQPARVAAKGCCSCTVHRSCFSSLAIRWPLPAEPLVRAIRHPAPSNCCHLLPDHVERSFPYQSAHSSPFFQTKRSWFCPHHPASLGQLCSPSFM